MQGGRKDSSGKKKIKAIAEMSAPDSESIIYSESLEQSIIGECDDINVFDENVLYKDPRKPVILALRRLR